MGQDQLFEVLTTARSAEVKTAAAALALLLPLFGSATALLTRTVVDDEGGAGRPQGDRRDDDDGGNPKCSTLPSVHVSGWAALPGYQACSSLGWG